MGMEGAITGMDSFVDKGADTISQVASGNFAEAASNMPLDKIALYGKLIFWFVVVTLVVAWLWKNVIRFNKKAIVKKVLGGSIVDHYITGVMVFKDGRGKLKLKISKGKKTCPVPSYALTSKMGKKDFYTLYEGEDGELYAYDGTHIVNDEEKILEIAETVSTNDNIDPQTKRAWRLEETKLAEQKYKKQSFFEKYRNEFILFLMIMGAITIIYFTTKTIESMYMQNAAAFREVAKSCLG